MEAPSSTQSSWQDENRDISCRSAVWWAQSFTQRHEKFKSVNVKICKIFARYVSAESLQIHRICACLQKHEQLWSLTWIYVEFLFDYKMMMNQQHQSDVICEFGCIKTEPEVTESGRTLNEPAVSCELWPSLWLAILKLKVMNVSRMLFHCCCLFFCFLVSCCCCRLLLCECGFLTLCLARFVFFFFFHCRKWNLYIFLPGSFTCFKFFLCVNKIL